MPLRSGVKDWKRFWRILADREVQAGRWGNRIKRSREVWEYYILLLSNCQGKHLSNVIGVGRWTDLQMCSEGDERSGPAVRTAGQDATPALKECLCLCLCGRRPRWQKVTQQLKPTSESSRCNKPASRVFQLGRSSLFFSVVEGRRKTGQNGRAAVEKRK